MPRPKSERKAKQSDPSPTAVYASDHYLLTLHTCICNQHKAHFGLPWVRYVPGTIAVNVTWMKRRLNACQTHRSMYPSTFNRFPVIQPVSSKVRHFSTFLHILASLGTPLGQSREMLHGWKEDSMLVKRIAAYTPVPIYLQLFTSYSEILVGNCNFFLSPCI